jgi:hypothetical protein
LEYCCHAITFHLLHFPVITIFAHSNGEEGGSRAKGFFGKDKIITVCCFDFLLIKRSRKDT